MAQQLEPLVFRLPPRDIRLSSCAPLSERLDALMEERERSAFIRGHHEGEKQLGEQLIHQRAEILELQNGVLETLRQAVPQVRQEAEKQLAELALELAHKLVDGLPVSREMVEAAVKSAMDEIEDTTEYTVQLHPEDLDLLKKFGSSVLSTGESADRVRFTPSGEVSRGGCIIQTRFGMIDARRETRVELLRDALRT